MHFPTQDWGNIKSVTESLPQKSEYGQKYFNYTLYTSQPRFIEHLKNGFIQDYVSTDTHVLLLYHLTILFSIHLTSFNSQDFLASSLSIYDFPTL